MILQALPILIPLLAAAFLITVLKYSQIQKLVSGTAVLALLAVALVLVVHVHQSGPIALNLGGWKAPYGIPLVVDMLSAIMLAAIACVAVVTVIYSFGNIDRKLEKAGYYPLVLFLLTGVNGALITGDIFNLYVWYEVMLTASFVLITLGCTKEQLGAGVKYLTINFTASIFFVSAIGILYGMIGSLNMAEIASRIREVGEAPYLSGVWILFIIAFSIKAALFPFFFWLPASYHTPPLVITALFSATLTKVAIYTLIRFQSLYLMSEIVFWKPLFLVAAGITMVVGVLMAASQFDMRKILSFHIISQVGYMVMGMAFFTVGSIAAAIYFIVHNIFSKTCLLLVAGLVCQRAGSCQLKGVGGFYSSSPILAVLFFIPALALSGIPPLPGFFGKFFLIKSGLEEGYYGIIAVAIFVGLVTLFSMIKIWNEVYWKKEPKGLKLEKVSKQSLFSTFLLMGIVVLMGVFAGPMIGLCHEAATQILEPDLYIQTVLERV